MPAQPKKVTIHPPPGRPSWGGSGNLPLIYLGWGERNFLKNPLPLHCDRGTSFYILLRGEFLLTAGGETSTIRGPRALIIDSDCSFGISQRRDQSVEILVWVWKQPPDLRDLRPDSGGFSAFELRPQAIESLKELHRRCQKEVALSDACLATTLPALRQLVEAEIVRASRVSATTGDLRWELAHAWMMNNLSIHTPVPALCDYLAMSRSSLHRFFRRQAGTSPGSFFRQLKRAEARRLVGEQGWQVKAAAYRLGYSHPNDLSRALGRATERSFLAPPIGGGADGGIIPAAAGLCE